VRTGAHRKIGCLVGRLSRASPRVASLYQPENSWNCSVLSPTPEPGISTVLLSSILARRVAHGIAARARCTRRRSTLFFFSSTALASAERSAVEPSRMSGPASRASEVVNPRLRGRWGSEDMAAVVQVRFSSSTQLARVYVVPSHFPGTSHRTLAICTPVFYDSASAHARLGYYHGRRILCHLGRASSVQSDSAEAFCKYSNIAVRTYRSD
jgi:hypothetical protein